MLGGQLLSRGERSSVTIKLHIRGSGKRPAGPPRHEAALYLSRFRRRRTRGSVTIYPLLTGHGPRDNLNPTKRDLKVTMTGYRSALPLLVLAVAVTVPAAAQLSGKDIKIGIGGPFTTPSARVHLH